MIIVKDLSKTYEVTKRKKGSSALASLFSREKQKVEAVKNISFQIQSGERVGFLGPNGAGKTTTLKMLAGLLTPTAGKINVLGLEPTRRPPELLQSIAMIMGQKQQLIWDLPPVDTFELNRAVYGVDKKNFQETIEMLDGLLELKEIMHKPTRQLSLGERMKCELAALLIHRPRILFLDEPTIGLDITVQAVVRDFVKKYNEETGATILLTSHYMEDVERLCPRILLIDHGSLYFDGTLEKLKASVAHKKTILVRLKQDDERAPWKELPYFSHFDKNALKATYEVPPEEAADFLKRALFELEVQDLRVEDPNLETIMRQIFLDRKQSTDLAQPKPNNVQSNP